MKMCAFDRGCDRPATVRDWCHGHYGTMHRRGVLTTRKILPTHEERFMAKVVVADDGCWNWQGARDAHYGRLKVGGVLMKAHRWAYERWVAPIADGLVVDHLCNNTWCVNPEHLQAVTQRENVLRSETSHSAVNARKTHCLRGHEFTEANTYVATTGRRHCRACWAIRKAVYRTRKVAS